MAVLFGTMWWQQELYGQLEPLGSSGIYQYMIIVWLLMVTAAYFTHVVLGSILYIWVYLVLALSLALVCLVLSQLLAFMLKIEDSLDDPLICHLFCSVTPFTSIQVISPFTTHACTRSITLGR